MNRSSVETFIALTKEKNIVKAADSLYLSPSTVSTQLKALENELGIKLFDRHKGQKEIALTPKGKAFLKIAYDFLALSRECQNLKQEEEKNYLSIATADSFLQYNLAPLYRQLVFGTPPFELEIKRYPADMIYPLVSKKETDVGFATYRMAYPDVVAEAVFSDNMVVLVPVNSKITKKSIHPSELDLERELLISHPDNKHMGCGAAFNAWRTRWIDAGKNPLVRANSISILYNFLSAENADFWMFAPGTTAEGLKTAFSLRILGLEGEPPRRTCYKLTHVSPSDTVQRNLDKFNQALREYMDQHMDQHQKMVEAK